MPPASFVSLNGLLRHPQKFTTLFVAALSLTAASAPAEELKVATTWVESGIRDKLGSLPSVFALFTTNAPENLTQLPEGVTDALFADFQTGPYSAAVKPLHHTFIQELNDGVPGRLFVNLDGDGANAKTEVFHWTANVRTRDDGRQSTNYSCNLNLKLTRDGRRGQMLFSYLKQGSSAMSKSGPLLAGICDYGAVGELVIGTNSYPVIVADPTALADFSSSDGRGRAPLLWVDANSNGKREVREVASARKPFRVQGEEWLVTRMTSDGSFAFARASSVTNNPAAEPAKKIVDLSPGTIAPAFIATRTDGKPVKFPADYKGKVVLLDFWATWCGPCIAEVPNVVENFAKFHDQGFEVLGVSLDREESGKKIAQLTQSKNMSWPQIYDGGFWEAAVAKQYGVTSIPYMVLVDGDTGAILAGGKDIRGKKLGPAIEQAMGGKKK